MAADLNEIVATRDMRPATLPFSNERTTRKSYTRQTAPCDGTATRSPSVLAVGRHSVGRLLLSLPLFCHSFPFFSSLVSHFSLSLSAFPTILRPHATLRVLHFGTFLIPGLVCCCLEISVCIPITKCSKNGKNLILLWDA